MSALRLPTVLVRDVALIAFVAVLVLFTNLGGPRLWDRDEPRNAGCAHEMLQRGDWITPVFNAELRAHKPVLLYWLMMSAYLVFGVNEFAARFWSAALAVGTVLCTYALGRRLYRRQAGVWAAIVLATALLFDVAGRAATPDSALIFFSTLALTIFVRAILLREEPSARAGATPAPVRLAETRHGITIGGTALAWIAVYAAMAMGVLAKGPVGCLLPSAVIGLFLLLHQQSHATLSAAGEVSLLRRVQARLRPRHVGYVVWSMRPLTALCVMAAVALPWYLAVAVRTDGQFLREFLGNHHIGRATSAMEGHSGSLLYYPVAILIGFFPWSVFAVPVLLETVRRWRADQAATGHLFSVCWIAVYVGCFSLASTKLPSYVTPVYPAIALLTGCFVDAWASGRLDMPRYWPRLALGVYALVGLALVLALPPLARRLFPGEEWLAVLGAVPLLAGVVAMALTFARRSQTAATLFAGSAVAFTLLLMSVAAQRVDAHQRNLTMLRAVKHCLGDVPLASYGCLEPSWVFYTGQPIEELVMDEGRANSQAWIEVGRQWQPKPAVTVQRLLEQRSPTAIITSDQHLETLSAILPPDFCVVADGPYFLRNRRLLVLARRGSLETAEWNVAGASLSRDASLRNNVDVR